MTTLNPNALLTTSLTAMSIMNATGKQIPEWLMLISLGVSVVGLAHSASQIVINDPTNMGGCGDGCIDCTQCIINNAIQRRPY